MKKQQSIFILFLLLTCYLFAGTPVAVKKNPAGICWQQYSTTNFEIIYSPGLDSLALQVGCLAEDSYEKLQTGFELKLPHHYKIFLTDLPDVAQAISQTHAYNFFVVRANTSDEDGDSAGKKIDLVPIVESELIQALKFENTRSWQNILVSYPGFAHDLVKNFRGGSQSPYGGFAGTDSLELQSKLLNDDMKTVGRFTGSYNSLLNIKPLAILPFPYPHKAENITGGIVSVWSDPLFTHQLGLAAAYNPANPNRPQYSFGYVNRQTVLDLSFFNADLETFLLDYAGEIIYQNSRFTTLSIGLPLKSACSEYARHYLSAGYTNQQKKILNPEDFLPENNEYIQNGKLPPPVDFHSANLYFEYSWKYLEPYSKNGLNPMQSYGFRLKYGYESTDLLSDFYNHSINSELFYLYPLGQKIGLAENMTLYLFSGFRMIEGRLPAQNRAGLDRYNTSTVGGLLPMVVDEFRRYFVRGNRSFFTGNRLISSTAEIYLPLSGKPGFCLQNLKSAQFGLAGFLDYGTIWQNDFFAQNSLHRAASFGLELRTVVNDFEELELYGGIAKNLLDCSESEKFYSGLRLILPF